MEKEAEYLAPDVTPVEKMEEVPFPLVRISEPMEKVHGFFKQIQLLQERAILWASKTEITNGKTRDEAITLGKSIKGAANFMDTRRKEILKPAKDYVDELNGIVKEMQAPLLEAEQILNQKIVDYNSEQQRQAELEKQRIFDEQKAARDKAEAEQRQRDADELARRQEDERRLEEIEQQAIAKAQDAGRDETDQLEADIAMEQEKARIESERIERERIEAERRREEQEEQSRRDAKLVADLAKANAKEKTKGVKRVYAWEVIDAAKVPRMFLTFDDSKVRKYLNSGVVSETDELKIIDGLRVWTALQAHKA